MNKNKLIEKMIETAKKLARENISCEGDRISQRYRDGFIINKPNLDLSKLTDSDFIIKQRGDELDADEALHMAIYGYKVDRNAIILNSAPYCGIVARNAKKLPALLDDFAQIVGLSAKVAKTSGVMDVLACVQGSRNACIIKSGKSLALGRTIEEAFTGSLVLEKGAKAFVEASILGNPKKIGLLDAVIMNFIYKKKYSVQTQAALMEDVKE
ncbi:MAG TPA: class II aldolase/adducin family protein [Clostridia bacterium]|jgi:L-fuculose-phosphate aldolase|nr:class II aldolase/adducin family protein [Clostridia bacterium]